MDFHTHNLDAVDAIISLPREIVFGEQPFLPREAAMYSAGVHPWWAAEAREDTFARLERLAAHPQVVAIGECGFDSLRGTLNRQLEVFERHVLLAEECRLPVIIHCVRSFHVLLAAKKRMQPTTQWTVHGFRGNATLASQLLEAGMNLSFGKRYNAEAFSVTPPNRRYYETDDDF